MPARQRPRDRGARRTPARRGRDRPRRVAGHAQRGPKTARPIGTGSSTWRPTSDGRCRSTSRWLRILAATATFPLDPGPQILRAPRPHPPPGWPARGPVRRCREHRGPRRIVRAMGVHDEGHRNFATPLDTAAPGGGGLPGPSRSGCPTNRPAWSRASRWRRTSRRSASARMWPGCRPRGERHSSVRSPGRCLSRSSTTYTEVGEPAEAERLPDEGALILVRASRLSNPRAPTGHGHRRRRGTGRERSERMAPVELRAHRKSPSWRSFRSSVAHSPRRPQRPRSARSCRQPRVCGFQILGIVALSSASRSWPSATASGRSSRGPGTSHSSCSWSVLVEILRIHLVGWVRLHEPPRLDRRHSHRRLLHEPAERSAGVRGADERLPDRRARSQDKYLPGGK